MLEKQLEFWFTDKKEELREFLLKARTAYSNEEIEKIIENAPEEALRDFSAKKKVFRRDIFEPIRDNFSAELMQAYFSSYSEKFAEEDPFDHLQAIQSLLCCGKMYPTGKDLGFDKEMCASEELVR